MIGFDNKKIRTFATSKKKNASTSNVISAIFPLAPLPKQIEKPVKNKKVVAGQIPARKRTQTTMVETSNKRLMTNKQDTKKNKGVANSNDHDLFITLR